MTDSLTVIGSELASVGVAAIGSNAFKNLPNVQSHVEGGGDLNVRQISAFKGRATRTALPEIAPVTITALHLPHHPAWKMIDTAARAGTLLRYRVETNEEDIASGPGGSGGSVSITTEGVVTFNGTQPVDVSDGMVIKVGEDAYTIDFINDSNEPVVAPMPETAVTGQAYELVIPSLQLTYNAKSGKPPSSLENEGDMTTSFSVYPRTLLPEWEIA